MRDENQNWELPVEEDAPWPSLGLNLLHIHSFPMCPLLIHHRALVGVGACGVGVWCPLWCQMWVWVCAGNGWWVWTWVWVGGAVSVGSSHNAAGGCMVTVTQEPGKLLLMHPMLVHKGLANGSDK